MGNMCTGGIGKSHAPATYDHDSPSTTHQQRPAATPATAWQSPLQELGRRRVPDLPRSRTSADRYVPLSSARDPRLDTLVAGRRNEQVISVSTATFNRMSLAHEILLRTAHETFPDGPGNQAAHVLMSGGRSWMRKEMYRSREDHRASLEQKVRTINETGGGNCGEYSDVVLAEFQRRRRDEPVFKVLESHEHSLVIVGDWRAPQAGDHAIVVDPWQGLPKIHTYGERINAAQPFITHTQGPGKPINAATLKAAFTLKPVSNEAVDSEIRAISPFRDASGPRYAQSVLSNNHPQIFDRVTGTQNLYTVYQDPDGRQSAFNSVPPSYLAGYLDARDDIVARFN